MIDVHEFRAYAVSPALGRRVDVLTEDGLSPYIRERVLAEAIPL
jgi:predicted nucleotidyltransferase